MEQSVPVVCVQVQEIPAQRMRVLLLEVLLNAALPSSMVVGARAAQSLQCSLLIKLN